MFKIAAFVSVVLLGGCATNFDLGKVHAQSGRTADQQQLDILTCKDQAHMAAEAGGQQTKEFLLGLTVVGYPAAIKSDRDKQRYVFQQCMGLKGYSVTPTT